MITMEHLGTRCLETPRLMLTPFHEGDTWAESLELLSFISASYQFNLIPCTQMAELTARYTAPDFYCWAVRRKNHPGTIGCVYVSILSTADAWCTVEFVIAREYWRQGYISEALPEVLNFLFMEVGFHRIQAYCPVNNFVAGRLLTQLGFLCDGYMREACRDTSEPSRFVDMGIYSILSQEWKHRRDVYEKLDSDARSEEEALKREL